VRSVVHDFGLEVSLSKRRKSVFVQLCGCVEGMAHYGFNAQAENTVEVLQAVDRINAKFNKGFALVDY
jgi:hypothetical protein